MKAWSARVAGNTWAESAAVAGFGDGPAACHAVKNYFGTLPQVDREDRRDLWRERYEALWRIALQDAEQSRPGALRAAVAVGQRAAALDGLDAPTSVKVESPKAAQLEALVQAMVEANTPPGAPREADMDELEAEVVEDSADVGQ